MVFLTEKESLLITEYLQDLLDLIQEDEEDYIFSNDLNEKYSTEDLQLLIKKVNLPLD